MLVVRRPSVLVAAAAVALGLLVPLAPAAQAQTVTQATIVSDDPAGFTPNVLDGRVNAFAQVGTTIIAGGSFTRVQGSGGGTTYTRNNIVAFNATTGAISTTFAPNVAGEVYDVEPAGDGTSVYVVGQFSQVNGTSTSKVTRLTIATGAKVAGFTAPTISQIVKNVDLVNGRLLIGGSFTTVGGQGRGGLASLDPTTGALTSFLNLPLSQPINGGDAQVLKMAVSPDGSRLVAVGNFTQVAAQPRSLIAMVSLTGATAAVSNWSTDLYQDVCSDSFDTYMRDLDFSPDSSYFVVSTTGAYGGPDSPCDVITRWESSSTGSGLEPTWRDYTGGDTTYAVAVTGAAVYVGGHMRWMNNPYAGDAPGPGAVPREGIAALDPVSGLPLSWNPGRARGVGVFDLLATSAGLWVGSDTDRLGGETHRKIGFFPLAGGTTPPAQVLGSVPNDVYLLGQQGSGSDPGVRYRVNAGGGEIQSADDGPDWMSDAQADAAGYRSGQVNAAGYGPVGALNASVPNSSFDRAPAALFSSEAWGGDAGDEMGWHFPVASGDHVTVRMYFANRYDGTSQAGQRVYDVTLDGSTVLPGFDPVAAFGNDVGGLRSFDITSDGSVDIGFVHQVENPLVNGIEIVTTGSQTGGGGGFTAADSVQRRNFTGTSGGPTTSLAPTVAWGSSRGGFMIDNDLYEAFADGTFTRRTFNGTTFGTPTTLPMYGGSFGTDIPNLTGLTYAGGRIYYTLFGDDTLYWRWFSPQSGVVGATPFTVGGDVGALQPSRVRGMFLAGGVLYVADRGTGDLLRIGLAGTTVTGPVSTADAADDWTARSLVLWNGGSVPPPNQNPTAVAAATCPAQGLTCTFSSAGSVDPDGTIQSYAWSFSDGGTSTAANPPHTFPGEGDYTATLTVTDNRGGTGSSTTPPFHVTAPPPTAPVAAFTSSCSGLTCTFTNTSTGATASSWDFGDTGTSAQTSPSHTYAGAATFTVTLSVTGPGGTDQVAHDVTVSAVTSTIAFRGAATANGNARTFAVPTPSGAQAGDVLLLFVTSALGSTPATAPAGWTLVGDQADGTDMRTTLYRRVAPATGALGTVSWSTNTKTNLSVLAYSGAAAIPTVSASAAKGGATSTAFVAPVVTVPADGSVVVSFWALRSSATATWTVPAGTTERADSGGSGSGQVGAAAADQLGVPAGAVPARTATATVSSAKGLGWTVVLGPA